MSSPKNETIAVDDAGEIDTTIPCLNPMLVLGKGC